MRRAAVMLGALLVMPRVAAAQGSPLQAVAAEPTEQSSPPPPFDFPHLARVLVGFGYVPSLPSDDRSSKPLPDSTVITAEIGGHPLTGVLGTGFSVSSATDVRGLWSVLTPGLFAKLDLTYLLLTGLWSYAPPDHFGWRLQVGGRLGLGISQSTRPSADVPYAVAYVLVRPELLDFVDLELPVGGCNAYSIVIRGATDTPVNLSSVFRWSVSAGVSYGWGQ